MVSIKKNNKGEFQNALGKRTRLTSIYLPGQNDLFKISRSKFSNFLDCPRCFYLDRVKGLQEPSMPGWSLNSTVDELLKKEFDYYRERKEPHPIFKEYKLDFIPFSHEDIDVWRNSLKGGISYHDENSNLTLHGGIDDIWYNVQKEELVVADYKAQSSKVPVETESYLASQYHQSYKTQMDIYVYILRKMGFKVSNETYFMVCNGEKIRDSFEGKMEFSINLIEYTSNTDWVDDKILEMKRVLDSETAPDRNPYCENCAYLEVGKQLLEH